MTGKITPPGWDGFRLDADFIYPPAGPKIHKNQVEQFWYMLRLHRDVERELQRLKEPGRQLELDLSKLQEWSVPAGGCRWQRSAIDPSAMMSTIELSRYSGRPAANENLFSISPEGAEEPITQTSTTRKIGAPIRQQSVCEFLPETFAGAGRVKRCARKTGFRPSGEMFLNRREKNEYASTGSTTGDQAQNAKRRDAGRGPGKGF